jgi:hypothetical protein
MTRDALRRARTEIVASPRRRLLRSLFERQSKADCDVADEPTVDEARAAVNDAQRVVDAVGAWLAGR